MDSTEIRAIYILLVVILALPISWNMGARWEAKNPGKLPFKWGYFQSICSILGIVMAVLALIGLSENENSGTLQFLSLFGIAHGIAGIFMLRRNRYWWIIGILLTLNPILWIANGIYLSNRWREMRSEVRDNSPKTRKRNILPSVIHLRQKDIESGPYHRDQITSKWNSSEITADTLFRESENEEWKPLLPYFDLNRKPWTIGRIFKRSILSLLGIIVLYVAVFIVFEGYGRWEQRPKKQYEFAGFKIGQSQDDVRFHHGEPNEKDGETWIYHDDSTVQSVDFIDNRVCSIFSIGNYDLLGVSSGSSYTSSSLYEDVLDKLGEPTSSIPTPDGLSRMLYYDQFNACFMFTKGKVKGSGIYDSTKGIR